MAEIREVKPKFIAGSQEEKFEKISRIRHRKRNRWQSNC